MISKPKILTQRSDKRNEKKKENLPKKTALKLRHKQQPNFVTAFSHSLQEWFQQHGRDLPWRRTRDPYAIIVSEFMLQQTQVATVISYYERWMLRFPTFESLAAAEENDVLRLWEGLGYYSRARNLHRLAREIVTNYNGQLPNTFEGLTRLPGIGSYTASAVLSFAFNQPAAVIDANIARVLARVFNINHPINTAIGKASLEAHAWSIQPKTNALKFNSSLMELGALICKAGPPDCSRCPVRTFCTAENPALLPQKSKKPKTIEIVEHRAFITDGKHLWLQQGEGKRWHGLWILPRIEDPLSKPDTNILYSITRYRVQMNLHRYFQSEIERTRYDSLTPHRIDQIIHLPIPSPHRRALEKMLTPKTK